jgi:hypothetical protein
MEIARDRDGLKVVDASIMGDRVSVMLDRGEVI